MKNLGCILVMVVAVTILCAPVAAPAADAGVVLAVKKDVFLVRGVTRDSARPQSPLLLKDAVETAQDSRTKLFFQDDSVLNLGQLSRVVVEEYLQAAGAERSKSVYRLVEGSLKVIVGKSELEIHTPTAVAAARGTRFIMWVEGSGEKAKTGLLVLEGEVLLRNIRDTVKGIQRVQKGQMSRVLGAGAASAPVPADPQVLQQFSSDTRAVGSVFEKGEQGLPAPDDRKLHQLAGAIRDQLDLLRNPPIGQEPLGASGHNMKVVIGFSQ